MLLSEGLKDTKGVEGVSVEGELRGVEWASPEIAAVKALSVWCSGCDGVARVL